MKKLFRLSTVPVSLNILLKGQLAYLNNFYQVTAVSGPGKDLDEVAEREKVKVFPIEMQRKISPVKDLVSLWQLYKYFRKEKPDIIHSITPKAGLLSMLAGKLAGVPIRVHTFTGLIFPSRSGIMQQLLINMDRLLCLSATHIIPEGEGVKNDLIQYHITKKALRIIANGNVNGIDTCFFDPACVDELEQSKLKNQLGISPHDFVFIFVGRLVSEKGINELVNAFRILKEKLQNPTGQKIKLLLVGPQEPELDPLKPEVLSEIITNQDIITVGFQQDVRPFFSVSDALVFPSYREGFPNVVMQAGAMGLPAIVTDINGCNEIIKEGKNGVIIPPKDSGALELAMQRLVTDQPFLASLQSNARIMIEQRYKQQVVWEALLDEYQKKSK